MQQHPFMDRQEMWVQHGHGVSTLSVVLLVLLTLAVAALVGYAIARLAAGRGTPSAAALPAGRAGDDPLALVRLRYARGEIDRETFLQTSADLGGEPPPAPA